MSMERPPIGTKQTIPHGNGNPSVGQSISRSPTPSIEHPGITAGSFMGQLGKQVLQLLQIANT